VSPLVSVIVPTFNGELFVRATLESVLAQTYAPIEVIVCDDGSNDGTLSILAEFGDRIQLVRQSNRGVAAARNRAAEIARGEFLAFLDHDDLWEPHMLATLVPMLVSRTDCGLVYADAWIIDSQGELRGKRGRFLRYAEGAIFDRLLHGNFIPVETTLMRADLFRELGGYDVRLRYLEDYELCLRIARRTRVGFHAEPLARYRIHDHNLSHELEPMLVEWLGLIESLRARWPELTPAQHTVLDTEYDRLCVDLAWRALRRRDLSSADLSMKRAGSHRPGSKALRVRCLKLCLQILPRALGDALLASLPRRRLYGVEIGRPGGETRGR
jgi:glycosyltransferase involved in cell wall biosynthesis